MTRRLIVNADDFGRSVGVDDGIMRAHRNGIVTSATLMTNAPATTHAAKFARETAALDVGVHLVVTYERPLSDPATVPSLVRDDGSFPRPDELLARDLDREEALREYRAQYARARELPHVPGGLNDPFVPRFPRLWPFLLTNTPARKISLGENGRRGEAPKCIYPHAALLEHVGYSGHPFE